MEASENEKFRDSIGTITEEGKRAWVFPKKPSGKYYEKRKIVSYVLLAFFVLGAFYKNRRQSVFNVQCVGASFQYLWTTVLATRLPSLCYFHDYRCYFHNAFYRWFWTHFLRLDLPTNHFYGNGVPSNRILD